MNSTSCLRSFPAFRLPVLIAVLAAIFLTTETRAVIKEPDNLVWGSVLVGGKAVSASETNIVVEARRSLSSPPLASYRMGQNPQAGDLYSLAIPLESVDPLINPSATRTGETILLLVHNGQFVRYLTLYTIGERGKIIRVDLGDVDTDNNGLIDNWERQYFITAGQDPNADPDRDGVRNRDEMLGNTNPLLPDARHPADVSPTNNIVTIHEVTAYSLAWKTGKAWPVAPTNIPVDFVARAGFLWKNGEKYIMDTNNLAAGAPLWWTNTPPETNTTRTIARASLGGTGADTARKSEIPARKSPIAGQHGLVTRSFQPEVSPEEAMTVTLRVQPSAEVSAYAVEETVPEGWTPSEITEEGVFDAASRRLRWGLYFNSSARQLSYRLQAVSPGIGRVQVEGLAAFDGWTVETSGPNALLPGSSDPRPRPAVLVQNGQITVTFAGDAGRRYQIEVSEDLAQWVSVATITANEAGQLEFFDKTGPIDRQRFYRTRRLEE